MGESTPELRVGDRERRAVDARLLAAVGDGVLTLHEYEERTGLLWQARTRTQLDALVRDLPAEGPPPPATPAGQHAAPQRLLAVMSEDRFSGALVPGQEVRGYAVMGKAVVDLRREDLPSGTRVQVRSVMGEVEVQVPRGSSVSLSGLAVLGERTVRVDQGDGPVVHVDAVAVLGTVRVTQGDGTVVPSARTAGPLPAQRTTSVPAARGHGAGSGGRLRTLLGRLSGLLVPVAVLGGVLLAGPDSAAVFGSDVVRVQDGDGRVEVSTLFGSVEVVVPDDATVTTSGLVVFGSTDCEAACGGLGDGDVLEVRRIGAFGSVEIVTRTEWADEQADERRGDD